MNCRARYARSFINRSSSTMQWQAAIVLTYGDKRTLVTVIDNVNERAAALTFEEVIVFVLLSRSSVCAMHCDGHLYACM